MFKLYFFLRNENLNVKTLFTFPTYFWASNHILSVYIVIYGT